MHLTLTTELPVSADEAWAAAKTTALLHFVARPLLVFKPLNPSALPEQWKEGRYLVGMRLFGWLPIGTQWIVSSVEDAGPERYRLRDNGFGGMVRRWDHMITIEPTAPGACRYTDRLDLKAGPLTPFVWCFARLFYAHRQWCWRQLAEARFAQLEAA